jgi:hypothetical protein
MSILGKSKDKKPYLEIKDVIVARSGIYRYTRAEVLARGHKPAVVKDFYEEFRPAAVIARAASLFDMVPVPNKEHVNDDITADNFHDSMSAMITGPITVVPMANNIDIGLKGRIAFYTKEAYEYYQAGNKETSADYESVTALVDNPGEVGYDLILTDIKSVNNVAITSAGRGGKEVRVQDSVSPGRIFDIITGREKMGILTSLLKIGKSGEPKFSAAVKDSLVAMKSADADGRQKLIEGVMDKVAEFTDTPMRAALQGIVRDSFVHPDDVLAKWAESEKLIDGVYARCVDGDAAIVSQVMDADKAEADKKKKEEDEKKEKEGGKKEEEDEKKKKESNSKDTAALVDEKIAELKGSLSGMIEESVKKALGLDGEGAGGKQARAVDSMPELSDGDASFAIEGAFGSSRSY